MSIAEEGRDQIAAVLHLLERRDIARVRDGKTFLDLRGEARTDEMRVRAPFVRERAGTLERIDDRARFGERIELGRQRRLARHVEALRGVLDGVLAVGASLVPERRAAKR